MKAHQKVILSLVGTSKNGIATFWVDKLSFTDQEDLGICEGIRSRSVCLDHVKSVSLLSHVNFPSLKITTAESDEQGGG